MKLCIFCYYLLFFQVGQSNLSTFFIDDKEVIFLGQKHDIPAGSHINMSEIFFNVVTTIVSVFNCISSFTCIA